MNQAVTDVINNLRVLDSDAANAAMDVLNRKMADDPDTVPERFRICSLADALQPQAPIEWVIEKLFSVGSVSLLVGEGGSKKTYVALDAAICVALGIPWLEFQTMQSPVLIVDEESGHRRLAERLTKVSRGHDAGPDAPVYYVCFAALNLLDKGDMACLSTLIRTTAAKLVIIDALADVMPGGDENAVQDTQPIFHGLRMLAEAEDCAICVIHHANRNGGYRGSSALKGAVDMMLMVSSAKDSPNVDFETEKVRDVEPLKFSCEARFGIDGYGRDTFDLLATPPRDAIEAFSKSEKYVLRYLEEHGIATVAEIKNHADSCSPETARRAVYSLVDRGKVKRFDGGGTGSVASYCLADKIENRTGCDQKGYE